MSKHTLFLALALAACADTAQEVEIEVHATVSEATLASVEAWPVVVVATMQLDKQLTPDEDRQLVQAGSEILGVFCDADDVAPISEVVAGSIGPCTEGAVIVEVSLAPLAEGLDCTAPLEELSAGTPFETVTVDALELPDACGLFDGAVDVEL